MKRASLPSLKELIGNWRSRGEFFFLNQFLEECRGGGRTAQPTPSPEPLLERPVSRLQRVRGWGAIFIDFAMLLARCGLMHKGRVLVFNHSSRVRRTGGGLRPLYLSSDLDLSQLIIFEDAEHPLQYGQGKSTLSANTVNAAARLIAALLCRLYTIRFGVTDPDIIHFVVRRAVWRLIFCMLSPAAIRMFVWYGKEAIISAAKSLQIEIADVQHGIIYRSHPFYNLRESQSVPGSAALLPDVCLVYGEYWRGLLLNSGWSPAQVKVVGYFLDTAPATQVDITPPYILYTSQPHTSPIIAQHIRSILPECRRRGWMVVIAPHPSEAMGLYEEILSDTVILAVNDSYDLLRECAVHVSVSSTLLWEAMIFNKPSYVLGFGLEAQDLLADLIVFGFGRPIGEGDFPEPYSLPTVPPRSTFFEDKIDFSVFRHEIQKH